MQRAFTMTALSVAVLASGAVAHGQAGRGRGAAAGPAVRPALLYKEDWKQPPYTGALNDANRVVTQDAVTNPNLELKLYGADVKDVGVYNHEGRFDLWNGIVTSSVAITLRHKTSYVDLTGLARLRATLRTMSLHTLYPVVKLADGTYVAGSRGITTEGEFLQAEVAFGGMHWFKLNPEKVTTSTEVKDPDLSKVDEVGFADLSPGGGHGVSGAMNISTIELFAKAVPR